MELSREFAGTGADDGINVSYKVKDGRKLIEVMDELPLERKVAGMIEKFGTDNEICKRLDMIVQELRTSNTLLIGINRHIQRERWWQKLARRIRQWVGKRA